MRKGVGPNRRENGVQMLEDADLDIEKELPINVPPELTNGLAKKARLTTFAAPE